MKKEIERLENTSIAVFGLMDDAAAACGDETCSCLVTGVQCCDISTLCLSSVSWVVCESPTTEIVSTSGNGA